MSGYYKDEYRYDDIINLQHHQSNKRPHMSLHDRAAQFAPFAALTGHEEAIDETARLTDKQVQLDDIQIESINQKLYEIVNGKEKERRVSITYFSPDKLKTGGSYLTDIGIVKKIDDIEHKVIMDNGIKIPMEYILDIDW
ncbi:MAG: hypothetical protein E7262_09470 [Lachnospiraceae bacterium]|nr:hypothetical protein [Lachnospiraceae bacterium]